MDTDAHAAAGAQAMDEQPAKVLKVYEAIIGGASSVEISVLVDIQTPDKYFVFSVYSDCDVDTIVYKYPSVNETVYDTIAFIEQLGASYFRDGSMYGPHLVEKNGMHHLYTRELSFEGTVQTMNFETVSDSSTPVPFENYFKNL